MRFPKILSWSRRNGELSSDDDKAPAAAGDKRSHRNRREATVLGSLLIAILIMGPLIAVILWFSTSRETAEESGGATMKGDAPLLPIIFGLTRDPATRTRLVDLCNSPSGDELESTADEPECPGEEDAGLLNDQQPERPRVLSAFVEQDLTRQAGSEGQFPASQLSVVATNVGRTGLLVSITANPKEPREVDDGEYSGEVVIERSEGDPIRLAVEASLESRGGAVAVKAFFALFAGALAGAVVKWLNDTFTPVAVLRSKARRLDRILGDHAEGLPAGAERRLLDVRDALTRFDSLEVSDQLEMLSRHREELTSFAYHYSSLKEELAVQRKYLSKLPQEPDGAKSALATEQEFINDLRNGEWPWQSGDETNKRLNTARHRFRAVTIAFRNYYFNQHDPTLRDQLDQRIREVNSADSDALGEKLDAEGASKLPGLEGASHQTVPAPHLVPDIVEPVASTQLDEEEVRRSALRPPTRSPRRLRLIALDTAWLITSIVAALVVAFIGYQTEFLGDASFDGGPGDYAALAAWALALQVAGTTVVQVVGRLATPAAASAT